MANVLQLIGLITDLIGVIIMATDLLRIDKTIGTWDWFDKSKEHAERNKSLTILGLIFIGSGFILQAASTIVNMLK